MENEQDFTRKREPIRQEQQLPFTGKWTKLALELASFTIIAYVLFAFIQKAMK